MKDEKIKIIEKKKVKKILSALSESYKILVPGQENGVSRFCEFDSDKEISWDYGNTLIPAKEILFPQNEVLFSFTVSGESNPDNRTPTTESRESNPEPRTPKTVIFGVLPCDARAITFLDKVFIPTNPTNPIDPYYLSRRNAAVIITLACSRPGIACFCTSVGGNPGGEEGSDIIMYDLGEKILIKTVTEKGEKLLEKAAGDLTEAGQADIDTKESIMKSAGEKVSVQVNTSELKKRVEQSFDADFWDTLHKKCLGCGVCTYLCPTCHCFDITDETGKDTGCRIRCWDSCQFPLFTLHASGHNPRPTYKERMRQRIMHKFNYCPENFEDTFCVGCGRCVLNCPVNLDIREILKTIISS